MALDRSKLAASGNKRRAAAAGGTEEAPQQPHQALGTGETTPVELLKGLVLQVEEATLGHVAQIGRDHKDVEAFLGRLNGFEAEALGYFCWLLGRTADPSLTPELVLRHLPMNPLRLAPIVEQVLRAAGLIVEGPSDPPATTAAPTGAA